MNYYSTTTQLQLVVMISNAVVIRLPEGKPRKPGKYNQLVLWHDRNVLCQRVVFRVYLLVDKSLKCEKIGRAHV